MVIGDIEDQAGVQGALNMVQSFWVLDREMALRRQFPAVDLSKSDNRGRMDIESELLDQGRFWQWLAERMICAFGAY